MRFRILFENKYILYVRNANLYKYIANTVFFPETNIPDIFYCKIRYQIIENSIE